MPRLSDSMEEGTVLKWMKSVGDQVALGDELVEIETDKANMVFEADAAGTLIEIVAGEGDTLPIGEVIARVGDPSEAPTGGDQASGGDDGDGGKAPPDRPRVRAADSPPDPSPAPAAPEESAPAVAASTSPPAERQGEGNGRVKASPIARRIAEQKGVDLATLTGSGPGGRIIKVDVEGAEPGAAPAAPPPAPAAPGASAERPETAKGTVETLELTKLQQTVGRRMAESKATAPHFYLQAKIDMSAAFEARARLKAAASEGELIPSFNDLVVKACAIALREFPRANGAYRDGRWELYSRINVGIAVAGDEALVVPTIFDADTQGPAPDRERVARARRARSASRRSRRPSSPAAPSPSPTSACTGSPTSTR